VNLPKLKVHRLARYTGGIKNMYGCVVGGSKQYYHKLYQGRPDYQEYWGKPLVDVFEAVEPHLTVMDAVIGLDKDGPAANGEPRFTGLLLVSESAPALDVIACRIIGIDTDRVPVVREAIARNLVSREHIAVHGSLPSIPYTVLPDLVPKEGIYRKIDDYVFDQFIVTPVIDRKACTRCDACVDGCATGAIRYDTAGLPVIDYGKCIYCYCCESYCGQKAIHLSGSALNMLMRAARYVLKL
jgi:Pyruvate/2-oxoacid:ferredoxin oxidoreductase delta subunit